MKRLAYKDLLSWKGNRFHKPLLVSGARKVGKTYLLKEFANAEYEKVAYFDFEEMPLLKTVFDNEPEASRMLRDFSSLIGFDITPGNTVVILDDIQACPSAIASLIEFSESAFGYDIIACGYLFANRLSRENTDLVIRNNAVESLRIFPFDFQEFLYALGKGNMANLISLCDWSAMDPLNLKYRDYLKQYFLCGGMPSVVEAYSKGAGPVEIRTLQNDILSGIEADILRFAPKAHIDEITDVFNSIPSQITSQNQKFMYSEIKKGARSKDYESSIGWLIKAGLVYSSHRVSTVAMPLSFYEEKKNFKLFLFDIGLAGAILNVDPARILVGEESLEGFNLGFIDSFVMGQLAQLQVPVCYYGKKGSMIDIDFIVQTKSKVVPLEVMPAQNGNSKAMRAFITKHAGRKGMRASFDNYFDLNWMENVPMYCIKDYLAD